MIGTSGKLTALDGRNVALTGGGGFIGERVAAVLAGAGARVTALLRSRHGAARLRALGATVAVVPLSGADDRLVRALEGRDAVVHAAYDMRAGAAENMAAFDALFEAAGRAGVGRFVQLSSVVVYDDWPGGVLNEDSAVSDGIAGSYRQAKIEMERRLLAGGFEAAILQPTIVYGPGSALWTTAPMAALASGGVVLPDPCGNCPAVHVDDVAAAVALALAAGDIGRERFLISGPDAPGWQAFFEAYRSLVGRGEVRLVPAGQLHARLGAAAATTAAATAAAGPAPGPGLAARVSARARRLVGSRRFERMLSAARRLRRGGLRWPDAQALALYESSPVISIEKAAMRLGYVPRVDFAEGISRLGGTSRAAFRAQGADRMNKA